jgi:transcriptional regulator with XRE-family HTH domain
VNLSDQLATRLREAMEADGVSQADLARSTGLSAKHVNHMVNGKSGALAMYDYAAFTLGRRWELTLAPVSDSPGDTR